MQYLLLSYIDYFHVHL